MANNYLEFSQVLTQLSQEEEKWLKDQLEFVYVFGDKEYVEDELPEGLAAEDADWAGCRAYRDMEDYQSCPYECVGFTHKSYEKDADDRTNWGRHLWLYSDEWGDVDRVVHLVQKFFRKFRPDQCWSLTYATTCSKPRVGEFGGGAVFVTAKEIKWQNAYSFIEDQVQMFKLQQDIDKLIQRAGDLGIESQDLDDLVHDAASSLASTINNAEVAEQIQWLIKQLGLGAVEDHINSIAAAKQRKRQSQR